MRFTKMHGAGNDFIIIDNMSENIPAEDLPELARRLCRRRLSIGADGMMVIIPAKADADFGMLFFNSDGSLGEMCGNGARCICRYGFEAGLSSLPVRVESTAGLVIGERIDRERYRVRLNDAALINPHVHVTVDGTEYDCAYVELGNPGIPHAVLLYEDFMNEDRRRLFDLGKALRFSPLFPRGANISFVNARNRDEVDIITFERGVEGFTLACGTGCGATAVSLFARGLCGRRLRLHAPGAELEVNLRGSNGIDDIFLSGPTCFVCSGEVSDDMLE